MEIQIVRHDGCAEDADGDVKHLAVAENFGLGDEAASSFEPQRAGKEDFVSKAARNGGDQSYDEGFHQAETAPLQGEDNKNIESSNQHAGEKRKPEEKFQRNRGTQDFGEVASGDGDFAHDPEKHGCASRVVFAAGLREIAARDDAQLGGKGLKEHRHEVAQQDYAQERVAEFGAATNVGGPVAGVHVADGDEVSGTGEREHFAQPGRSLCDGDGAETASASRAG